MKWGASLIILFHVFIGCLSPQKVYSQLISSPPNYKFTTLSKAQQFPQATVVDLFQDSYGFIWLATNNGLVKYDGYRFHNVQTSPEDLNSISSNQISHGAFYEDEKSDLWVATLDGGLNKFNRKTERFERFQTDYQKENSLSHNSINAIVGDGKNGLWIATNGRGLNHLQYSDTTISFISYPPKNVNSDTLLGSNNLTTLFKDKQERLWIGTNRGLSYFEIRKQHFERFRPDTKDTYSLSSNFVTHIMEDKKQNIWIGTDNGLNKWNEKRKNFTRIFPGNQLNNKTYDYILEIFQDIEGYYWLGTLGGLLLFDPENQTFIPFVHDPTDDFSIAPGPVYTIMEDKNHNLWIGTNNAISILNKTSARLNKAPFILLSKSFSHIARERGILASLEAREQFWIATQKGLYIYQYNKTPKLIMVGDFTALFEDSKGNIYAGTVDKGFYKITPTNKIVHYPNAVYQLFSLDKPRGGRIATFAEDQQGNIWIGSFGGFNRFDPIQGKFQQFYNNPNQPNSISNVVIKKLYLDQHGNLWIATEDGLNYLPKEEMTKPLGENLHFQRFLHDNNNSNTISNNRILTIHEDKQHNLWVGTDVGLNKLDITHQKWTRFYLEDGLPQNRITNILEDQNQRIWLTTFGGGVTVYDDQSNRFKNFTLEDGLNAQVFEPNSSIVTSNGLLFLAGVNGINVFDPQEVYHIPNPITFFHFTDFQVFNKSVKVNAPDSLLHLPIYLTSELHLAYQKKVFSIEFSTHNYLHPQRETYRYQLRNFDEDWNYIGNERKITFTNLFPGTYYLEVQTSNNQKDWFATGRILKIVIEPPWYLTWQFFVFLALSMVAFAYTFYRFQLNRRLALAEAQRLRELDQVKTNLYNNITHEFRTPLTIILGMTDKIEQAPRLWLQEGLQLIRRNGQSLLHLINQILDLAKLEAGSLPVTLVQGDLVAYLKMLVELFRSYADSKNIHLVFESKEAEVIMDYDADKIRDIVSNLLSNALKFTPKNGSIKLEVRNTKYEASDVFRTSHLELRVMDTGIGITPEKLPYIFDRFYQADDSATRRGEGTGIGLALTKDLVELLGGGIQVQSIVGRGSTFTIHLPIHHTAPLLETLAVLEPELVSDSSNRFTFSPFGDRDLPLALIVEDNVDVVTYLRTCLQHQYRIEVAHDGQAGIDKAIEIVPDVIISDVMMPEKDGFELCRTLKEDTRTSHIPIILLTARADMPSRLEGLEGGADAYLIKPFNEEELEISLRKSLELRQRLRERYAQDTPSLLGKAGVGSPDKIFSKEDIFIKNLHQVLEECYSNEKFTIPELAKLLQLSHAQLGRKMNALLSTSPQLYLRRFRLQKAYHLIKNTDLPIKEVAFQTGFEDPAYFSNIFLEEFYQRPSDLRE